MGKFLGKTNVKVGSDCYEIKNNYRISNIPFTMCKLLEAEEVDKWN